MRCKCIEKARYFLEIPFINNYESKELNVSYAIKNLSSGHI
jgi:tRNA G18 (ribose-2'-O)-methylase SpoU